MPTGAQLIVDLLEEQGVEVAFGLPGVHNLALWEALRGSSIRLVGVRHEQAAAYAADGYARATGRLGVAIVTTGPGAANTLGAVGEAWASRSPILVIATDIPAALRRPGVYRGVLHETTDQAAMFAPVVKDTFTVATAPEDAARRGGLGDRRRHSPRRARPAYLGVPTDLLSRRRRRSRHRHAGHVRAARRRRAGASALIDAAERPADLGRLGRDRRRRRARRARRADRARPVITTYGAAGLLPAGHPCAVGMPPHVEPVGRLWDEADLVIAVGSDLDGVQTQNFAQPQPPRLLAINLDPEDATKNYARRRRALRGRPRARARRSRRRCASAALDGLADRLHEVRAADLRHARRRARCGSSTRSASRSPTTGSWSRTCASPATGWPGFHTPAHPRKLQIPLGWGTLGYAFPAALGAALAGRGAGRRDRRRRRLPLRGRRARDGRPGADPADARDRRRRRLRDAALRPGRDAAPTATASTSSRRTSSRSRARSGSARSRSTGSTTSSAPRSPSTCSTREPSVLVASTPEPLVPPPNTSPNWYRRKKGA